MRRALTWLRRLLLLLALAGVVVTALPAFSGDTWWIRYLDFPRLEFLAATVIVAVLLLVVPRSRWSWLGVAALCGAAAYNADVLAPYSPLVAPQEIAAQSCPAGHRLRLLEVNVQMTNRNAAKLIDIVRRADPDVAWFQETNAWWDRHLKPLADLLPYGVSQTQPNYFGVHLLSKLTLVDPRVHFLTSSHDPSVFTGIRLPSGELVRLYAIHPRPPQKGQSTAERDAQLLATALAARADTVPHVVAGDMNSVPWEDVIRRTQRVGRFLDPRVGRGLSITWDAESWVLKWPLDQILPGPQFTLLSLQVLPAFGSDHRPFLAELCVSPTAAPRQPPPKLRPDDLRQAKAAVEKGQNAADKAGYKGHAGPDGTQTQPAH